jgi:hypothetical protein
MKIFFYPAKNLVCDIYCDYSICSQRCLLLLKELRVDILQKISVLPGGSHFKTSPSMNMRSGDLVILYAGSGKELEDLISIKDVFEAFRVILIVGQDQNIDNEKCHLLNPRYITSIQRDVNGLGAVIEKMMGVGAEYVPGK